MAIDAAQHRSAVLRAPLLDNIVLFSYSSAQMSSSRRARDFADIKIRDLQMLSELRRTLPKEAEDRSSYGAKVGAGRRLGRNDVARRLTILNSLFANPDSWGQPLTWKPDQESREERLTSLGSDVIDCAEHFLRQLAHLRAQRSKVIRIAFAKKADAILNKCEEAWRDILGQRWTAPTPIGMDDVVPELLKAEYDLLIGATTVPPDERLRAEAWDTDASVVSHDNVAHYSYYVWSENPLVLVTNAPEPIPRAVSQKELRDYPLLVVSDRTPVSAMVDRFLGRVPRTALIRSNFSETWELFELGRFGIRWMFMEEHNAAAFTKRSRAMRLVRLEDPPRVSTGLFVRRSIATTPEMIRCVNAFRHTRVDVEEAKRQKETKQQRASRRSKRSR